MNSLRTIRLHSEPTGSSFAAFFLLAAALFVTAAASAQTVTTLYTYPQDSRGHTGVLAPGLFSQGRDGNIYGTIVDDGTLAGGEVYRITPTGTLTTLYAFCAATGCTDGAHPSGGVILGLDGNFYGTTTNGGVNNTGVGTVFKLSPTGTHTKVYDFTSLTDQGDPAYGLVQGVDGNFYGLNGGVYSGQYGAAFKLTPKVSPPWPLKVLGPFAYTNGADPNLFTQGTDGNFYGSTALGGTGHGVVYKMTAAGKITALHTFSGYPTDGHFPVGQLVQGLDGNFYGVTYQGGAFNQGSIFKITAAGVFTQIWSFDDTATNVDGNNPFSGLTLGSDGNFYGTTAHGGSKNSGALYRITPTGKLTILHSFCAVTGCPTGFYPEVPLRQHTNGKFYGATSGNSLGGSYFYSLDVGLGTFIVPMTKSGKAGAIVEILGTGLTGATGVKFGTGAATSFSVVSDTYMTAVVPSTGTLGVISVATPSRTLVSTYSFKVIPAIKSFTPAAGPPGSSVVITGPGATIVGASFTAEIVRPTDFEALSAPPDPVLPLSLTLIESESKPL